MCILKKSFSFFLFLSSIMFVFMAGNAQSGKKIKTIIVDAGHGGSDDGAEGEYEGSLNSKEKNITLAISLKLVDELKKQMPELRLFQHVLPISINRQKKKLKSPMTIMAIFLYVFMQMRLISEQDRGL